MSQAQTVKIGEPDQIQQQNAGKPILIVNTLGKKCSLLCSQFSISVGNDPDLSFDVEDVVASSQNVPRPKH